MQAENEVKVTRVELKYCERCGGLWLRPAGKLFTYCGGCAREALQQMAMRRAVRRRP